MERIKNITILAALLLASAGCAKQEAGTQGPASLMSIEPEVEGTKAELINDATGLQGQGFGVSIYNGTTAYKGPVEMEYKNGAWAPKNGTMDWKWPSNTVYTFYAWSPADLAVGSVTSTGVPAFSYSGIADQKDIMLGSYTGPGVPGSGNVCAAPVMFSHALASVQFKTGTMTGLGNITKIELSGVATSGTCTPSYSGSSTVGFAWSSIGSSTTTLTQDGFSPASSATAGNGIGDPFLVLPQSGELTVSLTDSNGSIVTATISAPVLTVGHTTVYAVNFDGRTVSFTVSIEGWDNGQSEAVAIGEKTHLPDGALPGVFSVGADKQVHFSKGNLWADVSDYYNPPVFYFDERQYESPTTYYDDQHVGLFFWSKDASEAVDRYHYEAHPSDVLFTNDTEDTANPDFTVSGETGVYRTLSSAEWTYLLNGRTGAANKVGFAKVGDVNGIIILPDSFTDPMKNGGSGAFKPKSTTGWTANVYTSGDNWDAMEAAGAVFLPAAGFHPSGQSYFDIGTAGLYWSSSVDDSANKDMFFGNSDVYITTVPREGALGIRLVTDSQ